VTYHYSDSAFPELQNNTNFLENFAYLKYKHIFYTLVETKTNDYCSGCGQKETCREAYEKLGKAQGPSVVWKVIAAFLVPIAVFILSLAGADLLLRNRLEGKLLSAVDFLAAVGVTVIVVVVLWLIRRRRDKISKIKD
jgi:ABC-type sugar transport system permease subunit